MAKPSITYWNRLEPSPRADSLAAGLEAAVRDPLWFLARQWQLGEFKGEDAASPAYVTFAASWSRFQTWRANGGPRRSFDNEAPLESVVEQEAATPDWRTRVELGQALERRLFAAGADAATVQSFRETYPVPSLADLSDQERRDAALVRFLRICGGRGIDGFSALEAWQAAAPNVPAEVAIPPGDQAQAAAALADFDRWARSTYGVLGRVDAQAWRPDRLDYDVEVTAPTPAGHITRMRAHVGRFGEFDWHAFDEIGQDRPERSTQGKALRFSVFPTSVNLAGMPSSRWWQFEDARFNWANVDTDRREIAKAMVLDFMLTQGNDWFLVPFSQPVGSLVKVDQLPSATCSAS